MAWSDGSGNLVNPEQNSRQNRIDQLRREAEQLRREGESAGWWGNALGHAAEFWDGFFGMATPTYGVTLAVVRRLGWITQAEWSQFSSPSAYRGTGQAIGVMVAFVLPTRAVATRQVMWAPGQAAFRQALDPGATAMIQILLPGGKLIVASQSNAYAFMTALLTAMGMSNNAF